MPGSLHDLKEMLHVLYSFLEFYTVYFEVTKECLFDLLYSFKLLVFSLKLAYLIFYLNDGSRIYYIDTIAVNDAMIIEELEGLWCA